MSKTPGPDSFSDDLARFLAGALRMGGDLQKEAQDFFKAQVEQLADEFDLVSRDSFEAVAEMAARARDQNRELEERIAKLEKQLAQSRKNPTRKPPVA